MWHHPANRGRRLRKLIEATLFQARGRLLGKPSLARLGEYYLWADVRMSSSKRALYANPPDWAEMRAWQRLLRPGTLFVDARANIGIYTLWALQRGADVIAVEPVPEAVLHLRRNLALNGVHAEILTAALGKERGK